jgi:hypothetical protein
MKHRTSTEKNSLAAEKSLARMIETTVRGREVLLASGLTNGLAYDSCRPANTDRGAFCRSH